MSSCLDTDTLATIGQALDWNLDESLRHLLECEPCRESVAALASVQRTLAHEEPAAPVLVERIMSLMAEPVATSTERPRSNAIWLLNGGMAALTVLAVAGGAALQTGAPPPGWAAVGAALVVAGGYVWWGGRSNNEDSRFSGVRG